MIETAVVFGFYGEPLYWHEPPGRTGSSIPDSSELWHILWGLREDLAGVAHTHPWSGDACPSGEDLSTFAAVEAGLGKRLIWPVVTLDRVGCWCWEADGTYERRSFRRAMPLMTQSDRIFWVSVIKMLRSKSQNGAENG